MAFAQVGWRYYLVFIIVSFCGAPILYLFPETKRLSLEEIGALFGDDDTTVDPHEIGDVSQAPEYTDKSRADDRARSEEIEGVV